MLVPLDLATPSDVVLASAATLARRASVPLRLLTVASPRLDHDADLTDLGRLGADLEAPQVTIEIVESNDVVPALLDAAGPDGLLCLETQARGVLGSLVMRSVTADLIARSEAPVLLVGPHAETGLTFESMQLCVDGADTVAPLLAAASEWSGVVASARVVHVWVPGDARFHREASASACLEDTARRLRVSMGCDVTAELLHGDMAPETLIADADRNGVSITAVACRHQRARRRRVLGSVAMAVAHTTAGVVLAVPF